MKIKLIVILIVLVFTGCYQTTLYYWGNYSNSLYNYKKLETEGNLNKHIKSIEKIIKQSDYLKKKVPPGIYCEYGYYSMQEGNYSEAKKYFDLEIKLYPESEKFVTVLVQRIPEKKENE
ncbi:MAG: DUF4810 domain-containing protein [Candidatus Tenebribacter davisii]|nr:DUF4810 domain-containing protein [Candidatus Tenebribacter davisii]